MGKKKNKINLNDLLQELLNSGGSTRSPEINTQDLEKDFGKIVNIRKEILNLAKTHIALLEKEEANANKIVKSFKDREISEKVALTALRKANKNQEQYTKLILKTADIQKKAQADLQKSEVLAYKEKEQRQLKLAQLEQQAYIENKKRNKLLLEQEKKRRFGGLKQFRQLSVEAKRYELSIKKLGLSQKTLKEALTGNVFALEKVRKAMHKARLEQGKYSKSGEVLGVRNNRNGMAFSVLRSKLLMFNFALGMTVVQINKLINAYKTQEAAENRVTQTLKSTNYASGQTTQGLIDYAQQLQKTTGVSDELTLESSSLLATFTKIGGKTFKQAQKAVLDVTAGMNQGKVSSETLKTTTIQLGKALNDPIKGLNSLSRVGIKFSQSQKDQIKSFINTNQLAKAQGVILQELNTQFGNQASIEGYEKNMRALESALGDAAERIGSALLPIAKELTGALAEFVEELDIDDIKRYAFSLGLIGTAMLGMSAKSVVASKGLMIYTKGIWAAIKANKVFRTTAIGLLVTVGVLALEKLLDFFGVFEDGEKKVQSAGDKIRDFREQLNLFDISELEATAKGYQQVIDNTSISGLELVKNLTKLTGEEKANALVKAGIWKTNNNLLGTANTKYAEYVNNQLISIGATQAEASANKKYIKGLITRKKMQQSGQEVEAVDKLIKKLKNKLAILQKTTKYDKEILKASQDLEISEKGSIEQYRDYVKALEEVLQKEQELKDVQTQNAANLLAIKNDQTKDIFGFNDAQYRATEEKLIQEKDLLKEQGEWTKAEENKWAEQNLANEIAWGDAKLEAKQRMYDQMQTMATDFINNQIQNRQAEVQANLNADLEELKNSRKYQRASAKSKKEMEDKLNNEAHVQMVKFDKQQKGVAATGIFIDYLQANWKEFKKIGYMAAFTTIPLLTGLMAANIAAVYAQPAPQKFAKGGEFITNGAEQIIVGEAGREHVQITPIDRPADRALGSGGSINISFSGNIMSNDFIENEAIPQIKEAIRRGADIGIA